LRSAHASETGGLSGAPLKDLALEQLKDFHKATGGKLPLIAAGGIASGADAYARIKAGASLVQLYSALIYKGPTLPRRIESELLSLMKSEGHQSIRTAIASDYP